MEPDTQCILVLIGATPEGRMELIGFQTGYGESAQSWHELLADLKARGLAVPPELAIRDGVLGFWKALEQEFRTTRQQPRWVHKTVNGLNKLPKSVQLKAKADLKEIWMAEGRADAEKGFDHFFVKYEEVVKREQGSTILGEAHSGLVVLGRRAMRRRTLPIVIQKVKLLVRDLDVLIVRRQRAALNHSEIAGNRFIRRSPNCRRPPSIALHSRCFVATVNTMQMRRLYRVDPVVSFFISRWVCFSTQAVSLATSFSCI
jgi:hypothetical protein